MSLSTRASYCLLPPPPPPRTLTQYKFIVDGEWKYDPNQPAMFDEMGNVNNVIEVGTGTAGGGAQPSMHNTQHPGVTVSRINPFSTVMRWVDPRTLPTPCTASITRIGTRVCPRGPRAWTFPLHAILPHTSPPSGARIRPREPRRPLWLRPAAVSALELQQSSTGRRGLRQGAAVDAAAAAADVVERAAGGGCAGGAAAAAARRAQPRLLPAGAGGVGDWGGGGWVRTADLGYHSMGQA